MIRHLYLAFILGLSVTGGALIAADEEPKHDDQGHGPSQNLGEIVVGEVRLALAIAGAIAPGGEAHCELTSEPESATFTAIRVWIGLENGRGSEKARAEAEAGHAGHWSAHVAVPKPLPEGSLLWIQTQGVQGDPVLTSIALPQAGAAPQAAPAHDHDRPVLGHGHDH